MYSLYSRLVNLYKGSRVSAYQALPVMCNIFNIVVKPQRFTIITHSRNLWSSVILSLKTFLGISVANALLYVSTFLNGVQCRTLDLFFFEPTISSRFQDIPKGDVKTS